MKNSFSIVIPIYNRAGIVCQTLDSIKAQTYRPIHLILVDNNSSDNGLDVAQKWKNENESSDFKITIATQTIPGAAAARNKGVFAVGNCWKAVVHKRFEHLCKPFHCFAPLTFDFANLVVFKIKRRVFA